MIAPNTLNEETTNKVTMHVQTKSQKSPEDLVTVRRNRTLKRSTRKKLKHD